MAYEKQLVDVYRVLVGMSVNRSPRDQEMLGRLFLKDPFFFSVAVITLAIVYLVFFK